MNVKEKTEKIEQICDTIEKLKNEADELKKEIKKEIKKENKFKRWRAESGEVYYCFGKESVCIHYEKKDDTDESIYNIGNYFKTKEEAEAYKLKLLYTQELKDLALRLNKGWKPNWENSNERKCNICYSFESECFIVEAYYWIIEYTCVMFSDPIIAEKAIKIMGNEKLKIIFNIEKTL